MNSSNHSTSFGTRIKFDRLFWEKIKKDFNLTYIWGLFVWTLACLMFGKPINLLFGKIGISLFAYDDYSLFIYQWIIIVLFFLYFTGRLIFNNQFLWGRFPAIKVGIPVLIWYFININSWVKPTVSFIALPSYSNLNFLSLIYYICLVDMLFMIIYYLVEVTPRANKSSFVTDVAFDPESEEQEEILGFSSFAERIVNEIQTVSSSESVVIGINGEWGEGKTSMINLIRKQLKGKGYTVVDFHPWKTNSGKAMSQLFFDMLKDGLKNKIFGINWKIDRYADALLQLDKAGFGKALWQLFFQPDPVEKQKEKLRISMSMLDKNLVVVVDDLDRLAKNEIANVLKLIRDTANFPNLVFIAAYDRNYLNEAIRSEINVYNYKRYMDKIVLWEAPIYKPQPRKYIEILKNLLKEKLVEFSDEIDELFSENSESNTIAIYALLDKTPENKIIETPDEINQELFINLRIIKKFTNFLTFNIRLVKDHVVFRDFYFLYLLRYFYPNFYCRFITTYHELHQIKDGDIDKTETEIEKYIKLIFKGNETKENEKMGFIIKAIISNIIDRSVGVSSNSLIYYRNYLNYFHLGNHQEITMSEFSAMLKAEDFESFKKKLSTIIQNGNIIEQFANSSIINALQENFQFNDTQSYIDYFKTLVWSALKYDNLKFFQECHNRMQNICLTEGYGLNVEKVQIELKEFILKEKLQVDCQYFLYLIIDKIKSYSTSHPCQRVFYLSIFDTIEIATLNFNLYISTKNEITPELLSLFYCSYQSVDGKGNLTDDEEVISIMKEKAFTQPHNFIKFIVVRDGNKKHSSKPDNYYYRFVSFLLRIFNGYDEFISFLKNTDFWNENDRASLYLKYIDQSFPDKDISIPYPFLPKDVDYKNLFAGLDTLEILLDWKLREKIDKMNKERM